MVPLMKQEFLHWCLYYELEGKVYFFGGTCADLHKALAHLIIIFNPIGNANNSVLMFLLSR